MAQILNTSTDYLLDLTNNPMPANFSLNEQENNVIMNFRSLTQEEKIQAQAYLQALVDLSKLEK